MKHRVVVRKVMGYDREDIQIGSGADEITELPTLLDFCKKWMDVSEEEWQEEDYDAQIEVHPDEDYIEYEDCEGFTYEFSWKEVDEVMVEVATEIAGLMMAHYENPMDWLDPEEAQYVEDNIEGDMYGNSTLELRKAIHEELKSKLEL